MYRKAYQDLKRWKGSESRKPCILLGARQVGKTWLMREFGKREYGNVAYINCDTEPMTKTLFKNDYNLRRLLLGFQAITGETISEGETLIILDEIQEAPRALHALKYFCEEARGYHIMAAGSLLGVTLAHAESFPVGKVDMVRIFPMDFSEFLMANGEDKLCGVMQSGDYSLSDAFSGRLSQYLWQYYYVGGMPEVVCSFVRKGDLNEVRSLQSDILDAYRMDIAKHTDKTESVRIGQVLSSLPSQLARENRRFIYGAARKGGRAADFEVAIQWLVDAGLVYRVDRVSKVSVPLRFYEDLGAFKLFFLDVGLLCRMSDVPASVVLGEDEGLKEFKGMLAEEYVAQQLSAAGMELFYWSNDRTPAELDFVIQYGSEAYPIEVKSGTNVRGKSIAQYVKDNPGKKGFRFSMLGYCEQDWLTNIPLYAVPFWAVNRHPL